VHTVVGIVGPVYTANVVLGLVRAAKETEPRSGD
jgi:hypothetical protein